MAIDIIVSIFDQSWLYSHHASLLPNEMPMAVF